MASPHRPKQPKTCFVTIGATAKFDRLIQTALQPTFLQALQTAGYSNLILQHGTEGAHIFNQFTTANPPHSEGRYGLDISGFPFNARGLDAEMRAAKGEKGLDSSAEGLVISHAGSGTILHALRIAVPIVVVPNPDLLDNHQVELAEQLAKMGYVIHGSLDDLQSSISQSEILRERRKVWPPGYGSGGLGFVDRGLAGVMDDEMGFVD